MSDHQDSSADTSGSSDSTGGKIWLSGREAPKKPDSYFKESFEPSSDSGAPSLSVYIDYARFADSSHNSDSSGGHDSTSSKHLSLDNAAPDGLSENVATSNKRIAIQKSYQSLQNPILASNFKSQSSDTINTDVLLSSRKASSNINDIPILGTPDSNLKKYANFENGIPLRPLKHHPANQERDSRKTISTSLLDSNSIRRYSDMSGPDARSSSHYGDDTTNTFNPATPLVPIHNEIEEESEESWEYEKHSKPSIEEAVKLFKQEASALPPVQLIDPSSPMIQTNTVPKKASQSSLQSRVSDQTSRYSQTRRSRRGPQYPSLLTSILVPPPNTNRKKVKKTTKDVSPTIPALRKVSGNSENSKTSSQGQDIEVDKPRKKGSNTTQHIHATAQLPYRDVQDDLHQIYQYRDMLNGKDVEKEAFYAQYIDSSSISSRGSQLGKFRDIFSLSRIAMVLLLCMLVPPLYFIIGWGSGTCMSDKKLMKMIMNKEHREGILAGFVWDVNLRWFRNMCLLLGLLEVLIILACVGVGIGVGLSKS
ncbi:LANO_0D09230g1_1 [Lachancea nothofagi CBS 11611]|uniref:LANO_0D09230g1_1 n=1 Tax=Lachancea nothofagi CBS 11611 TaxID=1266666 RepID=A0A1G4JJB0_9SACH|nr:LANO_0D09230g1_1 [Lachancea nothofagi CBS 11611]